MAFFESEAIPYILCVVIVFHSARCVADPPQPPAESGDPPISITQWHFDAAHTGQNLKERIISPTNVNAVHFGKLFAQPIDGFAYAQPLYVHGVQINVTGGTNNGLHNVLFVATEHDSVYAYDADTSHGASSHPLWKDSFLDPARNISTIPFVDVGTEDLVPEIGITGTPVIDLKSGALFVVSRTKELRGPSGSQITHYVQTLHALDLANGAEKCGGPLILGDTALQPSANATLQVSDSILQYPGTGCPGDTIADGRVVFNAFTQNQRPSLILSGGVVYVGWASHGDRGPVHGWIAGFNPDHLSLESVLNTSPDGSLSTIWMGGASPAVDSSGNMYVGTGNGTFDANTGGRDYGESILRISQSPTGKHAWERLIVSDYFTPFNFDFLNSRDLDLGSGGPLLVPDQLGPHPHELITAGKEGVVYVLDTDQLGHIPHPGKGPDDSVQGIPANVLLAQAGGTPSSINSPAYWKGNVYYTGRQRPILQIPISGGVLSTQPEHRGNTEFNFPFPTPQISADGAANGIAWVQSYGTTGVLYAYDASDVSRELWNSEQAGKRDEYGGSVKFALPIIACGKVYVAGQTSVAAFGLLDRSGGPVGIPTQLTAQRVSVREIDLQWNPGNGREDGFKIERSRKGQPFTPIGATAAGVASFHDVHLDPASTYDYRVHAYNSTDDSPVTDAVHVAASFAPLTSDLLGWWELDEGRGNSAQDSSGHGNSGALSGEVSWMQGVVGDAALGFHGAGVAPGYVAIAPLPSLNFTADQSFTLSAWINPANMPSKWDAWIVHARESATGYGIWSNPQNQWVFGTPSAPKNLVAGPLALGWHHLVAVQDAVSKTRSFYVDGVLAGAGDSRDASSPGELWIGGAKNRDDAFVDGTIDDVRVYSRALTPAEVATLSKWRNPPKPIDLKASINSAGVTLQWTFPGQTSPIFRVERSVDGGFWSDVALFQGSAMTYVDRSALAIKGSCRYRICAIADSGSSEYSNVALVSSANGTQAGAAGS